MTSQPQDLNPTGTADLLTHVILASEDLALLSQANNLIRRATSPRGAWIEQLTSEIGPSRSHFRSTYFHWAIAINGLHVAAERYSSQEWQSTHASFFITGIRPTDPRAVLVTWSGTEAARAHSATVTKMATWGYIEMFAALEAAVFKIYLSYWQHHPDALLRGPDFKHLRQLKRAAEADVATPDDESAWHAAWSDRLTSWHRKRLYDGIAKVFRAMCNDASLKTPTSYSNTTIETWAETIEGLATIRHLLIHGAETVPQELEDFCKKPHSLGMTFKTGDKLRINLYHLQVFELFTDQLLTGLNLSALEHPDAGM